MAEKSKIEWTDATWQPITGCSIVSPGCTNCYAMKLAGGRLRHHPSRAGLTMASKSGPVWTGEVRFNEGWLTQPLHWRAPRRVFVCAHGDLFHEDVPDEWIDRVFDVMEDARRHTFQVLTKRSERMRRYLVDRDRVTSVLPNVWLGVSVERQEEAWERVPHLLQTPAAVRFVSVEPLLGPVDLAHLGDVTMTLNALTGEASHLLGMRDRTAGRLDWVIVGGESGKNARRMEERWARDIRDQCDMYGVHFFFKQWGAHDPETFDRVSKKAAGRLLEGVEHNGMPVGA